MTVPSKFQDLGLSIGVSEPLASGSFELVDLSVLVDGYQHSINVFGGYDDATIILNTTFDDIEDWYINGLMRHIEVRNPALDQIFTGFVNKVSVDTGAFKATRGPMLDVSNRVVVLFSPLDTDISPPASGASDFTDWAEDQDSIDKYGTLEGIFSAGNVTDVEAARISGDFVTDKKDPSSTKSISTETEVSPIVTLDILGYYYLLRKYIYQYEGVGLQNISDNQAAPNRGKMQEILDTDPNGFFSTDHSNMEADATQVHREENQYKPALGVLKEMVAARGMFGIYQDRRPHYTASIPTTIEYLHMLADPAQRITTLDGNEVMPWNVLPGKWLQILDFLPGQPIQDDPREDERAIFIERVTYRMPWSLSVHGGEVGLLDKTLAKLGLAKTT